MVDKIDYEMCLALEEADGIDYNNSSLSFCSWWPVLLIFTALYTVNIITIV